MTAVGVALVALLALGSTVARAQFPAFHADRFVDPASGTIASKLNIIVELAKCAFARVERRRLAADDVAASGPVRCVASEQASVLISTAERRLALHSRFA